MDSKYSHIDVILALRAARAALDLTQEEVANACGTSKATVARVEAVVGQPSHSTIMSLLDVYSGLGIVFSDISKPNITITITPEAVDHARNKLLEYEKQKAGRLR